MGNEYLSLLVVSLIAFLMPYLAARVKIPVIVGEILLGVAVGFINVALEWATGTTFLEFEPGTPIYFLSEMGIIFLLFLVGLEVDFTLLRERGPLPFATNVAMFMATLVLALGATWAIGIESPMFMALVLATTSIGVVMPVIRETGISRTRFGQDIILVAIIADFATMMLLPIVIGVESGSGVWLSVMMVPVVLLTFLLLYFLGGQIMWRWPAALGRLFKPDDPHETGVRASFVLIMVFVVLSEVLGTEAILGAFLAGAAISFMFRGSGALESKLFGLGWGFLIPIFFVQVGVQFTYYVSEPGGLGGLWLVPILVVIAYVVKVAPSLLHATEHGLLGSVSMGVLVSGGLSLAIAAAQIGLSSAVISEATSAAIILFSLVMAILSPIAFRWLLARMDEADGAGAATPDEEEVVVVVPGSRPPPKVRAGRVDDGTNGRHRRQGERS